MTTVVTNFPRGENASEYREMATACRACYHGKGEGEAYIVFWSDGRFAIIWEGSPLARELKRLCKTGQVTLGQPR